MSAPPRWLARARQLPRDKADTLLLLLACLLVLAPHALHLPGWITAAAGATLLWRAALTVRGARLPPPWLLLPVAVLAMLGVYASFHTLLGRDAGVAMLALLLVFKLLEMHARRDLLVVIFLSFFLLLGGFFYSQSIGTALMAGATILLLLTAQLSFQFAGAQVPLARRLRLAATIAGAAAPLAALLFLAFPRIQGPLWGAPGQQGGGGGRNGLSETMAPGNVSDLAQSEQSAFQVRFDGPAPSQQQLYWRAVVLAGYDGRTWTRGGGAAARQVGLRLRGAALPYQLTLEASKSRLLPVLEMPERLDFPRHGYQVTPELEFIAASAPAERVRYSAGAALDYRLQGDDALPAPWPWLQLPAGFNPRALAWAATLRRGRSAEAAIEAVLASFRRDGFRYTLQPALLGRHAVDEFLFDTRAGFCEHYAGAFVVLMRAMQIPARVVMGYQGGETNPLDGALTVRQSDAHAWAEVWLAGRGWLRVDPTAAVAPERVARNLAAALPPPAPPFGLGALGDFLQRQGARDSLFSSLRFGWNALNNSWNQWVLDYNPERQRGLLGRLGAALADWRVQLAGAAALALAGGAYWLRARRRGDPLDALYAAFCRRQAGRGCARAPDEGPQRYAARLAARPGPAERRAAAARFLAIYGAIKYGVASPEQLAMARKTLRRLLTQT